MKRNLNACDLHCTACFACVNVCPVGAVSTDIDDRGFYSVKISEDLCVGCGKCLETCPQAALKIDLHEPEHCYAFVSNNESVLSNSTSGGAFYEIAAAFLSENENSVVYGCSLGSDNSVEHIRCTNLPELKKTQGSKYVQSNMVACYSMIADDLKKGRKVLFSGTPCEVQAINSVFGGANLFLVDIVCHGVIGHKFFYDYLKWEERRGGSKIRKIIFRDKNKGWRCVGRIDFENGRSKKLDISSSYYYYYYFSNSLFRDSCYECKFARKERCGDITLGDFWGIDVIDSHIMSRHGCSLILQNTQKGSELLHSLAFCLREESLEDALKYNHQLCSPSMGNEEERKVVYDAYAKEGADGVAMLYSPSLKLRVKECAKDLLPVRYKTLIRKIVSNRG